MTWSSVQTGTAATTSAKPATVTLGAAVGNGNCLIVTVIGGTSVTVTDNKSNTYTLAQSTNNSSLGVSCNTYICSNITNGPTTITVNESASNSMTVIVDEIHNSAGAISSSPLDVAGGAAQSNINSGSNVISSGSITTTANGDLIYGVTMSYETVTQVAPTAGTGFTQIFSNASIGGGLPVGIGSEFKTQSSAGSATATFSLASSNGFYPTTNVISLEAPSGGGGGYVPYDPWPQLGPLTAQKHRLIGWSPNIDRRRRLRKPIRNLMLPRRVLAAPDRKLILPRARALLAL